MKVVKTVYKNNYYLQSYDSLFFKSTIKWNGLYENGKEFTQQDAEIIRHQLETTYPNEKFKTEL